MVGVESNTQVLSLTPCLVSHEWRHQTVSVVLFCNTFKQLYLKDERVNIISSIKNEHYFINILVLNIYTTFLGTIFLKIKTPLFWKKTAGIS